MPGRRLVDGRIVQENSHRHNVSWRRVALYGFLLLFLVASNPAHEATTARILERFQLDIVVAKWTGRRLSTSGSSSGSLWKQRSKTTNYGVAVVQERASGLQLGVAGQSWNLCSWDDADWGLVCRKIKTLVSHPGVEWWRIPWDEEPPVVLHRIVMAVSVLACAAVLCQVPVLHDDPLVTMFVPEPRQNPLFWLALVFVDATVLLFPVWERLYQVTALQATTSPCRIAGSDDALNFYAAAVVLVLTAAGVRLVTGHEQGHGWFVFVVTAVGYWRGVQNSQQASSTLMPLVGENQAESDLVLWMTMRLAGFVVANGLSNVGPILVSILLALFAGATWGDYHYNQQVWQVWTQSWSKMLDETWTQLFGWTPNYRAY